MHRSVKGLALLAVVPLALAACGSDSEESTSGGASIDPSSVSGTVQFWDTSDSTSEAPAFQKLIESFQAEYPNIKVEYTNVPFSEAQNKYKTAAQAGNAPDVLRAEVAWTPEFASLGYLQPLDETPLGQNTDAYLPTALSSNQYEGQLWGVPQVTDAPALLCNNDLLAKAGVSVPKTWDDVKSGAAAVTGAGATFLYGPTGGYFTLPYIYSQGGDMLDTEAKKILINDPQSVAGFQTALDLIAANAMVKPDVNDAYNNQQKLFKEGQVACVTNGPWSIADDLSGPAFADPNNLSVNLIPNGAETGASPIGGHNYVVYAGSKNLDPSYVFIEYMNSQASQVALAEEVGLLPTLEAAYTDVAASTSPNAKFVTAFKPVMDAAKARPWIPELGQVFTSMDEQWIKMYTGEVTAQQGADNVAKAWQAFLPSDYTD